MSKRKTDWEIIRGLADYICTFGDQSSTRYRGIEVVDYFSPDEHITLYVSDRYVSCYMYKDGKRYNEVNVHESSYDPLLELSEKCPNMSDIELPDVRYLNRAWRAKLRPLEAARDKIKADKITLERERLIKKLETLDEELGL